jgi:hypothetical protein
MGVLILAWEDVMGFRELILDVKARVAAMVDRGMSYEMLTAADPTAASNDRYGNPDRFLRAVYTELGGELYFLHSGQ